MSDLIGKRLGQYEILESIGQGGMASVYKAHQESMDRDVAVKVIKPDLAETGDFIKRFEREAKVIASLSHLHILKVFDYGEEEKALIAELDRRIAQYAAYMEDAEFRKALAELRAIWVAGNEYLTRAAPWTHIRTDRARAAVGVRMGLNLIHQFAHLIWPVMPAFARTVHECIQPVGYRAGVIPFPDVPMAEALDELTPGQSIKAPEVLVAKITDEQVAEWKLRFGGAG